MWHAILSLAHNFDIFCITIALYERMSPLELYYYNTITYKRDYISFTAVGSPRK